MKWASRKATGLNHSVAGLDTKRGVLFIYRRNILKTSKRLNRSSYILSVIVSFLAFCLIAGALSAIVDGILGIQRADDDINGFVFAPLLIAFYVYAYIAGIYRMHDLNNSGWFLLFIFVPLANLITVIYLLFVKSHTEANKWGEVPQGTKIMWLDRLIKPKKIHAKE